MNVAALFAMLLQTGLCAPVVFNGQDGSELTVLVCPMLKPIAPKSAPDEKPAEPQGQPGQPI